MINPIERICNDVIRVVDIGLKTTVTHEGAPLPSLKDADDHDLSSKDRKLSSQLMRVNHTGEVCAQALYEGQALTARSKHVRSSLRNAASEERDHLRWCQQRLMELNAKPSLLNPFFFATSTVLGAVVGMLGDRINLGFVEATEDQVSEHLDRHLNSLPSSDTRSREILKRIREDELRHGQSAIEGGGARLPTFVRRLMTLISRAMTATVKHI